MNKKALYAGVFINDEFIETLINRQSVHLSNVIDNIHCTFIFNPTEEEESELVKIIGREVSLLVHRYGHTENNSGFAVLIPLSMDRYYKNSSRPHITVSISDSGKPKDTGSIDFDTIIDEPFIIKGRFGICYTTGIEK